jgi:hypothetical protein
VLLPPLQPVCQGKGMDRLKTYIGALRVLARTNDPNRVVLIERNIDNYLNTESGGKERLLERLRVAINNEEAERHDGEDWSMAKECWLAAAKHDVARLLIRIIRNRRV